jgi:hypothetical protein
LYLLLFGLDVD